MARKKVEKPEEPKKEEPKVEKKEAKLDSFPRTGKFECGNVEGGFVLVGPDGRILSPVLTEEKVKDMVKKFNR